MSNHGDSMVSAATGGLTAIIFGGIWSLVGDVAMAFLFGFVGALGGWLCKIAIEHGKVGYLKLKQWVSSRLRR